MSKIRSNKISCPSCKQENEEDSNFCANCGEKLKDVSSCWVIKKRTAILAERKAVRDISFLKRYRKIKELKHASNNNNTISNSINR